MPFYDFRCVKCKNEFEVFAGVSQRDNGSIKCPECASFELETLYKGFNVIKSRNNEVPSCPHMGSCRGCIE